VNLCDLGKLELPGFSERDSILLGDLPMEIEMAGGLFDDLPESPIAESKPAGAPRLREPVRIRSNCARSIWMHCSALITRRG